jgi:hypothetical protein
MDASITEESVPADIVQSMHHVESWSELSPFIEQALTWHLQQAWLTEPVDGFRPGTVWVWRAGDEWCVAAELEDENIFNPVEAFNVPAFNDGDVFEIFLRPMGQEAYFEIHISPVNQLFQMRWPSREAFHANAGRPFDPGWFIDEWRVSSRVWVGAEERKWRVYARLPMLKMLEAGQDAKTVEWIASFSRYDHTRGRERPVHSSTSPHAKLDFHRQQEWKRMVWRQP